MVLSVRDLPREVGDKQGGMANPANGVVQSLGGGEGLVTALVGQDPDTGTKETLDDGVQTPQCNPSRRERQSLGGHKVVEEVEDGCKHHHIPGHIRQTPDGGTLEAVGWDGIPNLLDGEVGDLELVAVGVEHLAAIAFLRIRGHGGQRSGRGGLTRAVKGGGRSRDGAGVRGRVAMQRNALGQSRGRHDG